MIKRINGFTLINLVRMIGESEINNMTEKSNISKNENNNNESLTHYYNNMSDWLFIIIIWVTATRIWSIQTTVIWITLIQSTYTQVSYRLTCLTIDQSFDRKHLFVTRDRQIIFYYFFARCRSVRPRLRWPRPMRGFTVPLLRRLDGREVQPTDVWPKVTYPGSDFAIEMHRKKSMKKNHEKRYKPYQNGGNHKKIYIFWR